MARFKTWQQINQQHFVVGRGVSVVIGIEGNWLSLPRTTLEKLGTIADQLRDMAKETETTSDSDANDQMFHGPD